MRQARPHELQAGVCVARRDSLQLNLRTAARGLGEDVGITLLIVVTLGLGLGAASSMYGFMSQLLLQPPPHVASPERVARLYFSSARVGRPASFSDGAFYPLVDLLQRQAKTIEAVAAITADEVAVGSVAIQTLWVAK